MYVHDEHSDSPWDYRLTGTKLRSEVIQPNGMTVCTVWHTDDDMKVLGNASLIAAAPELLKAAREVWEMRGEIEHASPYLGIGPALLKLNNAVKKAEGRK